MDRIVLSVLMHEPAVKPQHWRVRIQHDARRRVGGRDMADRLEVRRIGARA
jgi:hypothetical protein